MRQKYSGSSLIPLSVSPAFMVTLVDWLMLNVNHTLGDGLSTFRIMASLIRQYAMPMGVSVGAASLEDRMFLTLRYRHAQFDQVYKGILLGGM